MYRQVGNKNKQLLSKMRKPENKHATWAIIGNGVDPLFMPKDAFVCLTCAGKVRYAQSVSNTPRPEPEPEPEPIIIIRVRPRKTPRFRYTWFSRPARLFDPRPSTCQYKGHVGPAQWKGGDWAGSKKRK